MAQYSIKIVNNSGVSKNYFAFMQVPEVSSGGTPPKVYSNVWVSFPGITQGGWDTAQYTDTTYACWSQPAEQLSLTTVIDSGGTIPVNTATRDTVQFSNAPGNRGFVTPVMSPGNANAGSFSIASSTDFYPTNGYVFGLARDNGSAIPSPVATFDAMPNEIYNITPVIKFYVGDGNYQAGQVIDITTISNKFATIDFTNQASTTATVIQGLNGAFAVSF
jgi:hypothetical protein